MKHINKGRGSVTRNAGPVIDLPYTHTQGIEHV